MEIKLVFNNAGGLFLPGLLCGLECLLGLNGVFGLGFCAGLLRVALGLY